MPWSDSTLCITASSITAPVTANRRAGAASATGDSAIVMPPPAAMPDAPNT